MDERLKALKSLQQLICLVAAAVLAFAMTTDRSRDYRAALDELEVFRKVDLKDYPVYVKRTFASQENANRDFLLKAAKQAHLKVRSSTVFSEPFVMDYPLQGANARLRDFEDFVTARHTVGIYQVNDEQEVFARLTEQLDQKAPQPVPPTQPVPAKPVPLTVTGIYANFGSVMSINNVMITDPVVLHNSPNGFQPLISPPFGEITTVVAPASSKALRGSVSSTCSNPSVESIAILFPFNEVI